MKSRPTLSQKTGKGRAPSYSTAETNEELCTLIGGRSGRKENNFIGPPAVGSLRMGGTPPAASL